MSDTSDGKKLPSVIRNPELVAAMERTDRVIASIREELRRARKPEVSRIEQDQTKRHAPCDVHGSSYAASGFSGVVRWSHPKRSHKMN